MYTRNVIIVVVFVAIGTALLLNKAFEETWNNGSPRPEQVTTNVEKSRMVDLMRRDAEALNGSPFDDNGEGFVRLIKQSGAGQLEIMDGREPDIWPDIGTHCLQGDTIQDLILMRDSARNQTYLFLGFGSVVCRQGICRITVTNADGKTREELMDSHGKSEINTYRGDRVTVVEIR